MDIDGTKINSKILNGKFYVKGGGGWYTLQKYIHDFFIKKQATKKHSSSKKSLMVTDLNKSMTGSKKVKEKTTVDFNRSFSNKSETSLDKGTPKKGGSKMSTTFKKRSSLQSPKTPKREKK